MHYLEKVTSFAHRTDHLKPEGAYYVLERAQALEAKGADIIHLEVGEPDFFAPEHVSQAGIRAIASGQARYTSPSGLTALREVIAGYAGTQRGIRITPEQVIVSPGSKPNLFFPTLAVVNPGDEVIYPDPGFPTYEAMIGVAGGRAVPVPLLESNGFSFDLEAFDRLIGPRTRLIILNSPSNPTGQVIPYQDLEHIAEAAQRFGAWVLSDEIYSQITYEGLQVPSIASLPGMQERTILVDGFSKTYAMTGWRLGYGIMPEALAVRISLLLTHSVGCTAQFTQLAGIEALTGPQDRVIEMIQEYQWRRDMMVAGLNSMPHVHCLKPQAAFYVFLNIQATGRSCSELADRLLEGGVAVLPGTAFGRNGEGYLRLVYANSCENIQRALERIDRVLRRL